jgi:hypothetical protein
VALPRALQRVWQCLFGTATQAELFRKLIALGEFVVEEGQRLALVDDEGRLSARVRLL